MYLLDSNTLITAKNVYYQMGFCPGFWEWLDYGYDQQQLASIIPVYDELKAGDDELADWVKARKDFFIDVTDAITQANYALVVNSVSSDETKHRTDRDKFIAKADPWLIAAAMGPGYTVVTVESLVGPGAKVVKIPNVCEFFQVKYKTTFEMLVDLQPQFGFVKP